MSDIRERNAGVDEGKRAVIRGYEGEERAGDGDQSEEKLVVVTL